MEGSAKRLKRSSQSSSPNTESHKIGSIVRVSLTNFVTFSNATFHTGPHLNVIIGPNGSGKSTFASALALGLGASPSVLGREKDPSKYVKVGTERAKIEIELKGSSRNVVVSREILKKGPSSWRVNGQPSTKTNVKKIIEQLNIQIDNLVQFLPQEKVASFAKMKPDQLLQATELAIGGTAMKQTHDTLIQLSKKLIQGRKTEGNLEERLHSLSEEVKVHETEVELFKKKEEAIERVKILNKKLPWLKYEKSKEKWKAKKEEEKAQSKKIKEARAEMKPLEKKVEKQKLKVEDLLEKVKEADDKQKKLDSAINARREQDRQYTSDIQSAWFEIQNAKNTYMDKKKRRKNLESTIRDYRKKRDELLSMEQIEEKQKELSVKNKELRDAYLKYKEEHRRYTNQARQVGGQIAQHKDDHRRLTNQAAIKNRMAMKLLHPSNHRGYQWLMSNKHRFKEPVYGPVFTLIQCKSNLHRKYLESAIGQTKITAIIVTNNDDQLIIQRKFKELYCTLMVVIISERSNLSNFHPPVPLKELVQYGVEGVLANTFTAENSLIKNVIINLGSLHSAYYRDRDHLIDIDDLHRKGVRKLFSPDKRIVITTSRYSDNTTTTYNGYRTRFLKDMDNQPEDDIKGLEAEIRKREEQYQQLQSKIKELQEGPENKKLERTKQEISEQQRYYRDMTVDLSNIKSKLNTAMEDLNSIKSSGLKEERDKAVEKHKRIVEKRIQNLSKLTKLFTDLTEHALSTDRLYVERIQAQHMQRGLDAMLKDRTRGIRVLKTELTNLEHERVILEDKARKLLSLAKNTCEVTLEIKALFDTLPDTCEELENEIIVTQAGIDNIFIGNPGIFAQYQERKKAMEVARHNLENVRVDNSSTESEIATIEEDWLTNLCEIIDQISSRFQRYMENIGNTGFVHLQKDSDDRESWGIEVKVSFREGQEPQNMDSNVQSGGERSVSTMLYLIALQSSTNSPFRLVDEINQGVDPINERKIFQEIVASACQPGHPQYFIITPKLLTGLYYGPNATIQCIYNGGWQPPQWIQSPEDFIQKRSQ